MNDPIKELVERVLREEAEDHELSAEEIARRARQ